MNAIDYCFNEELNTYVIVIKNKETNEPLVKRYEPILDKALDRLVAVWNVHSVNKLENNALK